MAVEFILAPEAAGIRPYMYVAMQGNNPHRFAYAVSYEPLDDKIEVYAVLHLSRDPETWQQRIR